MAGQGPIEITARTLDFGARVVAVGHITSVTYTRGRPFMGPGLALIALALAGIGYEVALSKGLAAIQAGGSTAIWLGLVALGVGVFALVYQRRRLVIACADGGKISLPVGREEFAKAFVARLGEAMRADLNAPLHYRVDPKAETIEILTPADLTLPALAPDRPELRSEGPNGAMGLPMAGGRHASQTPVRGNGALPHEWPASVRSNGHGAPVGTSGTFTANSRGPAQSEPAAAWPPHAGTPDSRIGWPAEGPPFATPLAGGASPKGAATATHGQPHAEARPSQQPAGATSPRRELDALIALVTRADIPHKRALLDLLAVVDDHLKGGRTERADAVAHWQSFASYVDQYLTGVEGLQALTRRVGRTFV